MEDNAPCALPIWQVVAALLPHGYKPYLISLGRAIALAVERTCI